MKVLIDDTIYEVIDTCVCCNPPEVCVLQTFECADKLKRQLYCWTTQYEVMEKLK